MGGDVISSIFVIAFLFAIFSLLHFSELTSATSSQGSGVTRHYHFDIKMKKVTRLCHTKKIVTVNGKFPGPKIVIREGDRLVVKVVNHVSKNITIHWHGVRQLRSGWSDGAAYVTQCPIQRGQSYIYNFTIVGQRGTLFWHAHFSWLRATVYGPLIILPKLNHPYPFPKPFKQVPILLGEWWKSDPEAVIKEALETGDGPNVSDAFTINGLPGPFYSCSTKDTFKLKVETGKTYLLRLINAAINEELFFSIANHSLEVVEADAIYIKPFITDVLVLSPGQTFNVLLKTKPHFSHASFLMLSTPYFTGSGTFDNSTVAAILEYDSSPYPKLESPIFLKPTLPPITSTSFATKFSKKFRSLGSKEFPVKVPKTIDRRFFFTVSLGTRPCLKNKTCQGPNGAKFAASINNISFSFPSTALLEAYYYKKSNGVFTMDFPPFPIEPFNYTGKVPKNTISDVGTKAMKLLYNERVEIVLQGTCSMGAESHPIHFHGYNVFVVGQGFGNFDEKKDFDKFNVVDPIERNTIDVPPDGWVVVRFVADNPGVWLMHCHFDIHMSWGLIMAWIVQDGILPNQKLPPPPSDLPLC